jgi:methylamine dehydrogenase accessory protein MauD
LTLLLFIRLALAAVFALAGAAKFRDRAGTRRTATDLGVPASLAGSVALLLPIAEIACAAALLLAATAWWGATGLLGLLVLFSAAMAVALVRGRVVECRCFGQLHAVRVGPGTLVRNLVLAGMAGAIVLQGADGVGPGLLPWVTALDGGQMLTLVLVAVIAFGTVVLYQLLRQYGRLLLRVEALEAKAGAGAAAPAGLPVGSPAPVFELTSLDGGRATLETLGAGGTPTLLLFVEPGCGACDSLLPDVAAWQREYHDRLSVVLVSRGSAETRTRIAGHAIRTALVQRAREVSDAFQIAAMPGAVLVKNGVIASPVASGPDAVRALVTQATLPPPLKRGDPLPAMPVRALDGALLDLTTLQGRSLLLFWNPGCGFCRQMLDGLKRWERLSTGGVSLVVVSSGPPADVREHGFASTVVLDEGASVMRVFGASGTPSAVLIREGRVESDLEVGAPGVWKLAGVRQAVPA